jgi:hypothetical protein
MALECICGQLTVYDRRRCIYKVHQMAWQGNAIEEPHDSGRPEQYSAHCGLDCNGKVSGLLFLFFVSLMDLTLVLFPHHPELCHLFFTLQVMMLVHDSVIIL